MKITIESTPVITEMGRVWHGVTESGIPCFVFVACVAVTDKHPREGEFERELMEIGNPGEKVSAIVHAMDEDKSRAN